MLLTAFRKWRSLFLRLTSETKYSPSGQPWRIPHIVFSIHFTVVDCHKKKCSYTFVSWGFENMRLLLNDCYICKNRWGIVCFPVDHPAYPANILSNVQWLIQHYGRNKCLKKMISIWCRHSCFSEPNGIVEIHRVQPICKRYDAIQFRSVSSSAAGCFGPNICEW